ncbi:hypothetical protein [Limosilactobacillus albertensis]|uniref:Helicase superfamily 3 single-stranded DNA/RNA virus domain-containing protein n=1 Tax=Limosilactobacillus albertensis TaxID=2759752 RepID=A0A839HB62_9LACO|nr:hypothetical protein [Limosilactobacillus albertensis]MBB1124558.1 hypothetical protein [Limosilactobacillus albertensis]MCD7123183.1 hypothetical protein [Limosilactobacillus albertensis]
MSDDKKAETIEEQYAKATDYLKRYSHSNRQLYQAILHALPPLKINDQFNSENIDLAIKAGEVLDLLGEASRTWNISIHWLFTVCNPKITDQSNPKYSPVYKQHATKLPQNRFGELNRLVMDESGNLIRAGDKLVGDDRFVGTGCEDYGSAWDNDGDVIKRDAHGQPILDGFTEWVAQHVNELQQMCCRNPNRDRHFAAFQINHTRDDQQNQRNGDVEHKESHSHLVIDMPTRRTRYRMMELMGYNFDDLVETFEWIDKINNKRNERIKAFLGTLQGAMQNYVVTKHYISSLQYLVHQSSKAKCDQKTPYAINEVISWLPDDPGKSYSSIAGVYDDEIVANGIDSAIVRNLHSPYNLAHHTARLVGRNDGDRVFSGHQLSKLRSLGTKGAGKMNFSKQSKKLILDQLMEWIYSGRMQVTDWKDALHAAFDDSDATGLIADQDFIKRLTAVMNDQRESTINDINADRDMTTIFITAAQGGIGKSYLASRLCQYLEKGRTPYMTAAEDKGKTVDYWQDYQDQASAVIDEVSPSSIEWSALKDMLDPHKIPRVSSRFHNTSPWNLNLLVMTNVYADGVAEYVRDVLHYAPGVVKLGYLEQSDSYGKTWELKTDDPEAGQVYLSQLSQLLRRLPINVHMIPTDDGKGTEIIVSIINFRPGGRAIQYYDYVYTRESDHIFNVVINEDLSDQDMERVVKHVAKMINNLKNQAKKVFQKDPNAILNGSNGFLERRADFGVYLRNGKAYLSEEQHENNSSYQNLFNDSATTSSATNMLSTLNKLKYELWPEFKGKDANFQPELNQFTALMRGYWVPIRRDYGDDWVVIKLSNKAMNLLRTHRATDVVMHLNTITSINDDDDFFEMSKSSEVARILTS